MPRMRDAMRSGWNGSRASSFSPTPTNFTGTPVTDLDTAKTSDAARFGRFFWAMMDRGVYLPCSQFEAAFVSSAHTEDDIDRTIEAARESLRACRSGAA